MPKITAYKCPFTEKLFETRRRYRNHLLRLRAENTNRRHRRREAREFAAKRAERKARLDKGLAAIRSATELEKFLVENFHELLRDVNGYRADRESLLQSVNIEWFQFARITYSSLTSNSHSCPRNGTRNFSRKPELPRGYPGFSGQMSWKVTGPKDLRHNYDSNKLNTNMSSILYRAGIHTGTGCPGWDGNISFEFFVEDFAGIQDELEKAKYRAKQEIFKRRLKVGANIREDQILNKHIEYLY